MRNARIVSLPSTIARAATIAAIIGSPAFGGAPPVTVPLNPKATFLHTNSDNAPAAPAIALATLGVGPGDTIRIQRVGGYDNGPGADVYGGTMAIFSASATLLAATNLHRVPDAIDAGVDFVSSCTYFGCQQTDVPEDFSVAVTGDVQVSVCVQVPFGATHVFIAAADQLFSDNSDPNGDYGVVISLLNCPADCAPVGGDATVDIDDLLAVINHWGRCPVGECQGDIAPSCGDGAVDIDDLLAVVNAWGPCQ